MKGPPCSTSMATWEMRIKMVGWRLSMTLSGHQSHLICIYPPSIYGFSFEDYLISVLPPGIKSQVIQEHTAKRHVCKKD